MLPLVVLGLRRRQSEQPTDIVDLLAFIEMRHCAPGVLLGLRYTVATATALLAGRLGGMQPSAPSASPSDQTASTERVTGDDLSAPDFVKAFGSRQARPRTFVAVSVIFEAGGNLPSGTRQPVQEPPQFGQEHLRLVLMALVDNLGAAAQGRLAALRENFEAGHEIRVGLDHGRDVRLAEPVGLGRRKRRRGRTIGDAGNQTDDAQAISGAHSVDDSGPT